MTEQEKINSEVQTKLAIQDAKFAVFMEELKQQREDIRRLNEKLDSTVDKLGSKIQNMAIAAVGGIGAIVIGGGAIIWSAISSLK